MRLSYQDTSGYISEICHKMLFLGKYGTDFGTVFFSSVRQNIAVNPRILEDVDT